MGRELDYIARVEICNVSFRPINRQPFSKRKCTQSRNAHGKSSSSSKPKNDVKTDLGMPWRTKRTGGQEQFEHTSCNKNQINLFETQHPWYWLTNKKLNTRDKRNNNNCFLIGLEKKYRKEATIRISNQPYSHKMKNDRITKYINSTQKHPGSNPTNLITLQ